MATKQLTWTLIYLDILFSMAVWIIFANKKSQELEEHICLALSCHSQSNVDNSYMCNIYCVALPSYARNQWLDLSFTCYQEHHTYLMGPHEMQLAWSWGYMYGQYVTDQFTDCRPFKAVYTVFKLSKFRPIGSKLEGWFIFPETGLPYTKHFGI